MVGHKQLKRSSPTGREACYVATHTNPTARPLLEDIASLGAVGIAHDKRRLLAVNRVEVLPQAFQITLCELSPVILSEHAPRLHGIGGIKVNEIVCSYRGNDCTEVGASQRCVLQQGRTLPEVFNGRDDSRLDMGVRHIELTVCVGAEDAVEAVTVEVDKPHRSPEC